MTEEKIPAISVIIPMYNMEKYIGECLDSILAQTFESYEVIVVDDCSTDKSREIVESYIPKFGGKLQLIKLKSNTGAPAIPRNTALRLSRGKYIMFVDSDDAVTPTAMEDFHKQAEEFDADVICCGRQYKIPPEEFTTDISVIGKYFESKPDFDEIVHESDDLLTRVKHFSARWKYWAGACNYLFSRNLILKHDLRFPNLRMGEDRIFDFYAVCFARHIIFSPNCYYLYRLTHDSACRAKLPVEGVIRRWGKTVLQCVGLLDSFMDQFEQLKDNVEIKYAVFESFVRLYGYELLKIYKNPDYFKFDNIIRDVISELEGDKTALTAFCFNRMNTLNYKVNGQARTIQKLEEQIAQQKELIKQLQHSVTL